MSEYPGVQLNRTPGVAAPVDVSLQHRLERVLCDYGGVSFAAASRRPIETLVKLLQDREGADWRDAFMAALAGGRPIPDAKLAAELTVELFKQRRRARLEAGS